MCLQGGGSLAETAIQETEDEHNISMQKVYFDSTIQARDAFFGGRCDSYVTDGTAAAGQRACGRQEPGRLRHHRSGHIRSNQTASPLPAATTSFFDIVRWTVNALLWAETNGIDSKTLMRSSRPEAMK